MISLSVQLMGTLLCTIIAYGVMIWLDALIGVPLRWTLGLSFGGGIVAWAVILFCTPMFGWWFGKNNPMEAAVLGNLINRDQLPKDDNDLTGMYPMHALYEVGPGWYPKLPTHVLADDPISLQASILIGHSIEEGNPLEVRTKNNVILHIDWQTKLSPLRNYLGNFIRYTDESQINYFLAEFNSFLLYWASTKTDLEIFAELRNTGLAGLKDDFKNLFGGRNVVDDREKDRGMFSGDPEFRAIKYTDGYLKAIQAKAIMEKLSEGLKILMGAFIDTPTADKFDPNLAMFISAAVAGVTEGITPIIGIGLGGFDKETLAAYTALQEKLSGKGGKKDNKKK